MFEEATVTESLQDASGAESSDGSVSFVPSCRPRLANNTYDFPLSYDCAMAHSFELVDNT